MAKQLSLFDGFLEAKKPTQPPPKETSSELDMSGVCIDCGNPCWVHMYRCRPCQKERDQQRREEYFNKKYNLK